MGTNLWYAVNLAVEHPLRLLRELSKLAELGITNIRILATSQGPDSEPWRMKPGTEQWNSDTNSTTLNEKYLKGLDFLLSEAGKRDISVVIMFNNFWQWSGGFAQYVKWFSGKTGDIPYPVNQTDSEGYRKYMEYTEDFYKCTKCMDHFVDVSLKIINRNNTVTGVLYKDDPTIMAWELANEPFPVHSGKEATVWINNSCTKIKDADHNHMVAIGNIGIQESNYNDSIVLDCIDYGTFHVWPQNSGWYDPKRDNETYQAAVEKATAYIRNTVEGTHQLLKELEKKTGKTKDKPLVLEEFGLARDKENFFPENSTYYKDRFYEMIFQNVTAYEDRVSGVNFWAWAGEGRPNKERRIWNIEDPWIGDPPHENQGWYSVYDTDTTVSIIKSYAKKLNRKYDIVDHKLQLDFWLFFTVVVVTVIAGVALDWILRKPKDEKESEVLLKESDI